MQLHPSFGWETKYRSETLSKKNGIGINTAEFNHSQKISSYLNAAKVLAYIPIINIIVGTATIVIASIALHNAKKNKDAEFSAQFIEYIGRGATEIFFGPIMLIVDIAKTAFDHYQIHKYLKGTDKILPKKEGLIISESRKICDYVQGYLTFEKIHSSNFNVLNSISSYSTTIRELEEKSKALETYKKEHPNYSTDDADYIAANKEAFVSQRALSMHSPAKTFAENNFEKFITLLITQIPNVKIDLSKGSSASPITTDLNNNGLEIEEKNLIFSNELVTIKRDNESMNLQAVKGINIDGHQYNFIKGKGYFDGSRLYYNPEDALYHDHVIASGGNERPAIITLCDGSGHSNYARVSAKTASDKAHNTLKQIISHCSTTHEVLKGQIKALKNASEAIKDTNGATTYLQASIIGDKLIVTRVGDSQIYVFRPKAENQGWTTINILGNTKNTLNPTEPGGQLDKWSDFHLIHVAAFQLMVGDVVYLCSDGISDNLDPSSNNIPPNSLGDPFIKEKEWELKNPLHIQLATKAATNKLDQIIMGCTSAPEISKAINDFIQENTRMNKINLMSNPDSTAEDHLGKLDDAASAFFVYTTSLNE